MSSQLAEDRCLARRQLAFCLQEINYHRDKISYHMDEIHYWKRQRRDYLAILRDTSLTAAERLAALLARLRAGKG